MENRPDGLKLTGAHKFETPTFLTFVALSVAIVVYMLLPLSPFVGRMIIFSFSPNIRRAALGFVTYELTHRS